jgi:hypothetical protein
MIKLYDILLELNSIEEANKFQKAITTTALAGSALLGGKYAIDKINQDKPEIQNISTPRYADQSNFRKAIIDIVDNIEGGYYNPGQVGDKRYSSSGETMFGIDRKNFPNITDESYIDFWDIIDDNKLKHPTDWKWNYSGGKVKNKLKNLVLDIMEPLFNSFFNRYLSDEAKKIVKSDYKLYFNFVYATWNGQGWFRKFAKLINKEVKNGNFDTENLFKKLINARRNSDNSLIAQQADKIEKFANK